MNRLLLVGGGHSHVQVLRALARERSRHLEITVVSREVLTPYSGMLPGVVAGHYEPADARIDLGPLCKAADARLVQAEIAHLDPDGCRATANDGATFDFDLVSINSGSAPGLDKIAGARETGVSVRPISEFLARWDELLPRLRERRDEAFQLVVVGAGAGGVEMAFALDYRLRQIEGCRGVQVSLLDAADRLLPAHTPQLARRVVGKLKQRGIGFFPSTRITRAVEGGLTTENGETLPADEVLWVTSAGAQAWPRAAGLAVDAQGFIRVNAGLRSASHSGVFASGDAASFERRALPKAGVYAVRQGPLLAGNLLRAAAGKALRDYQPQQRYLMLISTGSRYAIAARGRWTAEGAWAWRWKDWIDRRFIRRFRLG